MADESVAPEVAERAAGVLAPESDLFEDLDSAGFGEAMSRRCSRACADPTVPGPGHPAAGRRTWPRSRWSPPPAGSAATIEPPVPVDPKDRRFADPAWSSNPLFYGVRLAYLSTCRFARDVVGAAALDADVARKAALAPQPDARRAVARPTSWP